MKLKTKVQGIDIEVEGTPQEIGSMLAAMGSPFYFQPLPASSVPYKYTPWYQPDFICNPAVTVSGAGTSTGPVKVSS